MEGQKKRAYMIMRRKQNLMSQIEVAKTLGISQAQYSYIENGYADPDEAQAKTLISMLGLPDDYFDKKDDGND